ncbi:class I SAM-dependent methyltransferase [Pantanalinema rosaneae CENA516]|uniref:class I SAM-dependent methyltransferase n=1 Tax=Pantanalinema rosaneae TaxID=1620701 RepID=UPI003D6E9AD3
MDIPGLIAQLPTLAQQGAIQDDSPILLQFQDILEQTGGRTTLEIMQLLHTAIDYLEAGEVYCEVGCSTGANLVAAFINHPDRMAYAIVSRSEENLSTSVIDHLSQFELQDQVLVSDQGLEVFLHSLQASRLENRIGLYFAHSQPDYRSQLLGLLRVQPFLADRALIILAEPDSSLVQQASQDFLSLYPQTAVALERSTVANNGLWQEVMLLSWDTHRTENISQPASQVLGATTIAARPPAADHQLLPNVTVGQATQPQSCLQWPLTPSRMAVKQVLHVGCGVYHPLALPVALRPPEWQEVRLDIDPQVKPDIVSSITHMPMIRDASFEAVYSSHNLEHLYAHEVPLALAEFYRVLKPGGLALITLPDLQQVAAQVAQGSLEEPLCAMHGVPIAAVDILYGYRDAIADGNVYMAHRTGFTAETLRQHLATAGFQRIETSTVEFNLWAIGYK